MNRLKKSFAKVTLATLVLFSILATTPSANAAGAEMNIRFAPLSLLIGWLNVDLDVRVSNQWTLGPTIGLWRTNVEDNYFVGDKYQLKRNAVGVRANWSQSGSFQTGFYVSPIVQFVRAEISGVSKSTGNDITASASGVTITGIAGYQWFWDTFNLSVGGGLILGAQSSDVSVQDGPTSYKAASSGRGTGAALDFMLGWTF